MKRLLWFILGLAVGIAATLGYFALKSSSEKDYDMTFFDQHGQIMDTREYVVVQAWPNATAIAMDDFNPLSVVLLWNKDHNQYYDGQTIKAGRNQLFRQVGLCRYLSKEYGMKTVPIVELVDKE